MSFVQLTLADALLVANSMRAEDRHCLEVVTGACNSEFLAINRFQTVGAAWALYEGGRPVAMLGLSEVTPWCLNAWMLGTPAMSRQSWKKLLRFARTVRGNALRTTRRIECMVLSTWPRAVRFAYTLGFELEGAKRGAGKNGEDILLFAIIKRTPE